MPTGDNYLTLWNALINKYQDTRALATAYIDQLLKLKKVVNATPATLDEFADKYATTIAALKQLKINDLEEFMFLHLGLKCLDTETARAFEMYKRDEDFPNSDDLTQFIREQSRILSRASLGNTSHSAPPARAPRNIPTQGSQSFARPASNSQQPKAFKTFLSVQNATDNDANKNLCPYCQSSAHNLYACPLFTPLSHKIENLQKDSSPLFSFTYAYSLGLLLLLSDVLNEDLPRHSYITLLLFSSFISMN
ncbi:hypothetical protein NE865_01460 [Phthorimaea operculella]|nr:hypothetical protein NE865_01460 [Phthorimaea operculella]